MNKTDPREPDAETEFTGDELAPGTQLSNGTYTILKHLKAGGFGITYLANDTLGRRVVIKECFPGGMCGRSSKRMQIRSRVHAPNVTSLIDKFVVEAHSLAKLSHPNIVKVHQVFKENDTAYMALDFVDGHDLIDIMRTPSLALSPAGVRSTLLKLLDAITAVHDTGLLHRDISPDNILVDAKRNPILIDFGAAKDNERRADSPASALHVVKDGYSPQELYLAGGGDQGPWSDLYALAASFYHVITGDAPPNSQARLAALAANAADPCVPLAGRFPDYDAAFLAAIDKAMSVLPKQRLQSARQWIGAISETDGGNVLRLPVQEVTRTVTPMTRLTKTEADAARKKTGPIVLIGGALALSITVVGVYLAMPDNGTATVSRLPADVAAVGAVATEAASVEPAPAAPAPAAAPTVEPVTTETAAPETASVEPVPATAPAAEPKADDPPPAATVAAAEPVTSADSALTSDWTVAVPFAATASTPTTVERITGPAPDWLVPGMRIVAVNGTPITTLDEIPDILSQSQHPGEAQVVTATLATVAEGTTAQLDQTMDLPVVHTVDLASGEEFQAHWENGAWQTEVSALPDTYSGKMRVGDVITGHIDSRTKLTGPNDLKTALETAIASGTGVTTFAVQQDDKTWVMTFDLPK
jgi:hypothetical protein